MFRCSHRSLAIVAALASLLATGDVAFAQGVVEESTTHAGYDPGLIDCAVGSLFQLIEGSFGALVMVVAGLGAIVSAAFGAYRASVGMLVVAVGSFILRSLVHLFFGGGFEACDFE